MMFNYNIKYITDNQIKQCKLSLANPIEDCYRIAIASLKYNTGDILVTILSYERI